MCGKENGYGLLKDGCLFLQEFKIYEDDNDTYFVLYHPGDDVLVFQKGEEEAELRELGFDNAIAARKWYDGTNGIQILQCFNAFEK